MSLFALVGVSCDKIIAEDITGEIPVLILPAANDTVDVNPVHFKWDEMEGASKYHLMIVSPSFSSISSYVLDTVVTGTNFYFTLDSNEYELKFAGQNAGYTSDTLGPVKFWVGIQPSSSGGTIVLTSPTDSSYENATFNNQFLWESFAGVDSYEISIREGTSFASGTILDVQNNIATTVYTTGATLTEGEYHWGVNAYLTAGGEIGYSTQSFFIDTTGPNIAGLMIPTDLSFLGQGLITFTWNNGTDPGTIHAPVNSTLEIASDAGFTSIDTSITMVGNTTDVTLTPGTYYWRVTNMDDAGNIAAVSAIFQLTLN